MTALDTKAFPGNTYTTTRPTGARVFVRPNQYEAGRANIAVYNWDRQSAIDVDLGASSRPAPCTRCVTPKTTSALPSWRPSTTEAWFASPCPGSVREPCRSPCVPSYRTGLQRLRRSHAHRSVNSRENGLPHGDSETALSHPHADSNQGGTHRDSHANSNNPAPTATPRELPPRRRPRRLPTRTPTKPAPTATPTRTPTKPAPTATPKGPSATPKPCAPTPTPTPTGLGAIGPTARALRNQRTNLDAGVADSGVPHKNAGVVGTPADTDTFCRRTKPDTAGGEPPDGPRARIEL